MTGIIGESARLPSVFLPMKAHRLTRPPSFPSAFTCQLFFAWRVYRLMHSIWVPIVIAIFSAASLCGALGSTIGVVIVKNFAEFQKFQVSLEAMKGRVG